MRASHSGASAIFILAMMLSASVACKKSEKIAPAEESYTPAEGAVALEIIPLNSEGAVRWLATFTDGTKTTKFQIELMQTAASEGGNPPVGKGQFVSQSDSDPLPLLAELQKALRAKHMPRSVEKAEALPFEYMLLGENLSRTPDGALKENPKGNWTGTKIFLANDQAEVYFNFNPVIHKAEFSIKDPDYGDRLLAEFAKVF